MRVATLTMLMFIAMAAIGCSSRNSDPATQPASGDQQYRHAEPQQPHPDDPARRLPLDSRMGR